MTMRTEKGYLIQEKPPKAGEGIDTEPVEETDLLIFRVMFSEGDGDF